MGCGTNLEFDERKAVVIENFQSWHKFMYVGKPSWKFFSAGFRKKQFFAKR